MFEIISVANMSLDPLLAIRIENLDNNFAHFFHKFILVFLLYVTAGVCCCLSGFGLDFGNAGWCDTLLWSQDRGGRSGRRQGDVDVVRSRTDGSINSIFSRQVTELCFTFSFVRRSLLFSSDLLNSCSLLASLLLLFFPFLKRKDITDCAFKVFTSYSYFRVKLQQRVRFYSLKRSSPLLDIGHKT